MTRVRCWRGCGMTLRVQEKRPRAERQRCPECNLAFQSGRFDHVVGTQLDVIVVSVTPEEAALQGLREVV